MGTQHTRRVVDTAPRRAYHFLLQQKREKFWTQKIASKCTCPRKLWRSVDALMGRGRVSASGFIGVTDYHAFFDEKIAGVRATTADADPATYTPAPPGYSLSAFQTLTTSDVINAVKLLPDKQC